MKHRSTGRRASGVRGFSFCGDLIFYFKCLISCHSWAQLAMPQTKSCHSSAQLAMSKKSCHSSAQLAMSKKIISQLLSQASIMQNLVKSHCKCISVQALCSKKSCHSTVQKILTWLWPRRSPGTGSLSESLGRPWRHPGARNPLRCSM